MTQKPGDEGEKPQLKVSMLKDKEQRVATGGGLKPYATSIAVVVVGIVIVVAILSRTQQPTDSPTQVAPSNTPAEVGTIQALETSQALLITPSLDPNVAALQTQNAQLAQSVTDQAGTNQAVIAQQPSAPQIITATPQPPAAQPTAVVVVTVPPPATQSSTTGNTAQKVIENCPNYLATGKNGAQTLSIDVPAGQIVFVDAYAFDSTSGGVFVTIIGEYHGTHTIRDGALCGGINVTDNYEPVKQQRRSQLGTNFTEISLPQAAGNGQNTIANSDGCSLDGVQLSSLVGGQSQYWTPPPFDGAAWVYKNKGNFVAMKYPGYGRLDIWIDGAVSIYDTNKNLLTSRTFDEASFHCKKTKLDCPTTAGGVADLVGGSQKYWTELPNSNATGWKYGAGSPAVIMTAPSFGRVDYWNGQTGAIRNGQQAQNVTEATLWCGG